MEKPNNINPAIASLIVIVLIGASTAGVAYLNNDSDNPAMPQITAQSSGQAIPPPPSRTPYKDGTYSSQGSYITPGGRESIGLTVMLKNGIIEVANLQQQASGGDTVLYQRKFASGYKAEVIGKNIDEVKLNRVAGSSLTSNGFNDALEHIKTDATL